MITCITIIIGHLKTNIPVKMNVFATLLDFNTI